MPITKEELVSAINSYATARASGDPNLMSFSAKLVEQAIGQLDFAASTTEPETAVSADESLEDGIE